MIGYKWPHIYNSVAPVHERDFFSLADDFGILLLQPHNLQWNTLHSEWQTSLHIQNLHHAAWEDHTE